MGWASEEKAIRSKLESLWTATPIKLEEVPFPDYHDPYIALFIRHGDRGQLTLGTSPTIQSVSAIIIQVFVPGDTGSRAAKAYADSVAAIFDRIQFFTDDGNLISCLTASAESIGKSDEWFQYNVTIPYTRTEN